MYLYFSFIISIKLYSILTKKTFLGPFCKNTELRIAQCSQVDRSISRDVVYKVVSYSQPIVYDQNVLSHYYHMSMKSKKEWLSKLQNCWHYIRSWWNRVLFPMDSRSKHFFFPLFTKHTTRSILVDPPPLYLRSCKNHNFLCELVVVSQGHDHWATVLNKAPLAIELNSINHSTILQHKRKPDTPERKWGK